MGNSGRSGRGRDRGSIERGEGTGRGGRRVSGDRVGGILGASAEPPFHAVQAWPDSES